MLLALALAGSPTSASAADRATDKAADKRAGKSGGKRSVVRGTLVSLPPIVQPGASPAAPSDLGSLVATFETSNPGQEVVLEKQTARGWKAVDTAEQDAWGSAAFSVRPGTYRARTGVERRTWLTGTIKAQRWSPTFEDTFSGSTLNPAVWNDQEREHESINAARTCARVDSAARRVTDGVLHLGVALDPARAGLPCNYATERVTGTSPYLLTSQVATEHTRFFQHGIIAARIKPQRAKGMHSGFWLLPQGTKYTYGVPAGGTEIDVMEFWGENGRGTETIGAHVHYYNPGFVKASHGDLFPEARRVLEPERDWWDEFHVFSVEWTPTEYVFRVDGREYYREANAVSQAPQYLVLSMLASDYELDELSADEIGRDTAQVDWVRVFDGESSESARVTRGRPVAARR